MVQGQDGRKPPLLDGVRLFQGSLEAGILDGISAGRTQILGVGGIPPEVREVLASTRAGEGNRPQVKMRGPG
jgi:hypothetical protein